MKQFVTAFIHNWSPWHLRKRVAKLEHDLDHLTERRDDFISEANRHNVKENERLIEENEELKKKFEKVTGKYNQLLNDVWGKARTIESQAKSLLQCCHDSVNRVGDQQ